MSTVMLGEAPGEREERDAIHVAIVPMVASEMLRPGQRVGVLASGIAGPSGKVTGIVDPFLTDVVPKGARFWMCLLPGIVTGMRHHWMHPEFETKDRETSLDSINSSFNYLRRAAQERGLEYDEFMEMVANFIATGNHVIQGGRFEGMGIYDDEFWTHYENVTGTKVKEEDRGSVFSCSC